MKKTLIVLVLLFSLFGCERNYIKDYKIEGIGLGDSLLDHFSEEQILTNQVLDEDYYKDNEFKLSSFEINNVSSEYDKIGSFYKTNDKKFIVKNIYGVIFTNNIEECRTKKEEIIESLTNLLKNVEWETNDYEDEDGVMLNTYSELRSGEYIVVQCYDWSNKIEKAKGWLDHLRINIASEEYRNWLHGD